MKRIRIDCTQFQLRKRSEIPQEIELNREVSWMLGMWIGDNWSSKEGTVIRNGQRSSGKFGINSNDEEVIQRFLEGLRREFKVTKIKIDVQVPRNQETNKEKIKEDVAKKFGIEIENVNVYRGSPWRKKTGFAVYTNNTALLRVVNKEIYQKLSEYIQNANIDISSFLQGIADSEGSVDKVNKIVKITNNDQYVVSLIELALRKLNIKFKKAIDAEDKVRIKITDLVDFDEKVGFWIKRKQQALQEMLSGNFVREKDKRYLRIFENELKRGVTVKEISQKFGIAYSTVKMILKNLALSNLVERKKMGSVYIYYLP